MVYGKRPCYDKAKIYKRTQISGKPAYQRLRANFVYIPKDCPYKYNGYDKNPNMEGFLSSYAVQLAFLSSDTVLFIVNRIA